MIQNIVELLHTTLIELNIFTVHDMGSNIDQVTAKRYGQLATRFYVILFLSGLTIVIFYTIFQPHIVSKNFDKPSFDYYNHLRTIYGDKLTCSCSVIASTYNQFINIQSIFHSVR